MLTASATLMPRRLLRTAFSAAISVGVATTSAK